MEEDSQIARERQQLRKEKAKLQVAIESIEELENSSADYDVPEDSSTHTSTHTIDAADLAEEEDILMDEGAA